MSKNNEKNKNKIKNNSKIKDNLDMLMNNNEETYQSIKIQKIKGENNDKKKSLFNNEEINDKDELIPLAKRRKRSNSVDLYKKQQREKEKKNKKESNKNIKIINNINNNDVNEVNENTNQNINKKSSKNLKNGKIKKVTFPKNFVTIIDVESYKKFNEENTCKDPFEDMEFLKKIKNLNFNINDKEDEDEEDGKARVNCSCLIC